MSMSDAEIQGRYEIKCADCGKRDSVPFRPDVSRPVYCGSCWRRRRDHAKGISSERILRATSIIAQDTGKRSGYFADKETVNP